MKGIIKEIAIIVVGGALLFIVLAALAFGVAKLVGFDIG